MDLEYADDIVLQYGNVQSIQCILDRLAIEVLKYGICFTPSNSKVLLQVRQEPVPLLILFGDLLEVFNSFRYLGSLATPGGDVGEEAISGIGKARAVSANL